jgi:hypothetical protein
MRLRTCVASAVLLLAACNDDKRATGGKQPEPAAPTPAADEQRALDEMIVKRGREDLQKLEGKLAAKTVGLNDCVVIVYLDELDRVDAPLATRLRQLCAYDVPVALLENGVPAAEAARKAQPDAISLKECDVSVGLAIEDLEKRGKVDDKARALISRFDAACPLVAKARADRALRKSVAPAAATDRKP